jgi:Histidine kinase-like ATPase domain
MSTRRFPPDDRCLAAVRQFLLDQVVGLEPSVTDMVVLLGHELAANAVAHAQTDFAVHVAVTGGCIEVAVSDWSPQLPHLRYGDKSSIRGRGLRFVAACADHWGVRRDRHGKSVWFQIATETQFGGGSEARERDVK